MQPRWRAVRRALGRAPRGKSAHLLQLLLGGHLLGHEGGLDAVEEAFEPADQLGVGDAQLGVTRGGVAERQGDAVELVHQLGGEPVLELLDRTMVNVGQASSPGLVEWGVAHLLEQLLDHRADAHDLGRLLDQVGRVGLLATSARAPCVSVAVAVVGVTIGVVLAVGSVRHPHAVLGDDDDAPLIGLLVRVRGHVVHPASRGRARVPLRGASSVPGRG